MPTKLQDFRIEFGKPDSIYAPNDVVSGRVHLRLSSSKNVREIRLETRGEANVHWKKTDTIKDSNGANRSQTVDYNANEQYFSHTFCLFSSGDGSNCATIPAGDNVYNFQFQLPSTVPCSIEHNVGYVRYTVKAILDRPWRFDQKTVAAFTVIRPHNLNEISGIMNGINDKIIRSFRYFCIINLGEIVLEVLSGVKGFVPGEKIQFNISYDNRSSNADLTKIKINLEQKMTFMARSPRPDSKVKSQIIAKQKSGEISNKKGSVCLVMEVPPIPPSNLEGCAIINLSYCLNLYIHLSGMYSKIIRSYPVEIGTIPLRPLDGSYTPSAPMVTDFDPPPQYPRGLQPPHPIGFVTMNTPPFPMEMINIPPPTYEQCVSGSNHIIDQSSEGLFGSNTPFSPRYPVYKFPIAYQ